MSGKSRSIVLFAMDLSLLFRLYAITGKPFPALLRFNPVKHGNPVLAVLVYCDDKGSFRAFVVGGDSVEMT